MSSPFVYEGNLVLYYVPEVADIAAPTTDELDTETGDAVRLMEIPSDGVAFGGSQNNASTPMLDGGKISQSPGTEDRNLTVGYRLLDAEDDMDDLWERNLSGCIIAIPHDGDTVEADQKCYVYQGAAHAPMPTDPSQDSHQRKQVTWAVADWDEKAVVADAA